MKLKQFAESRQDQWQELEELLGKAKSRPERLPPAQIRRMSALYRRVAADVAIARREFPGDPVLAQLERLAAEAFAAVYGKSRRREALLTFFADGYWKLLRDRRRPLMLAAVVFVGSGIFGAAFAALDPTGATAAVPEQFLWVIEADSTDQGLGAAGLAGFSTAVLVNNILVTALAFALGITFGIGTGWILIQNGYIIGILVGLAFKAGSGGLLIAAVAAHGILELSCIVVGGAAGFAVGRSMLRPGKLTRLDSLAAEVPAALKIAAGTAPWLVFAGFVEGFASRTGLGWPPTLALGIIIGGVFWGLYAWRSALPSPEEERAAGLARA